MRPGVRRGSESSGEQDGCGVRVFDAVGGDVRGATAGLEEGVMQGEVRLGAPGGGKELRDGGRFEFDGGEWGIAVSAKGLATGVAEDDDGALRESALEAGRGF